MHEPEGPTVSRSVGSVDTLSGLGHHDHVCWVHDDADAMLVVAAEFLAAGLWRGQRVGYVGGVGVDRMTDELVRLAGDRPDAAFTADQSATYQDRRPEPQEQVRIYRDLTQQALRDGFAGLRVAADATRLVDSDDTRWTFLRYEHLVDRAMSDVDARELAFVDHTGLQVLADAVGAAGGRAVLHCRSTTPARLAELLGIEHLTVEVES